MQLSAHPTEITSPREPQLGALLVEEGLITYSQLQEALRIQKGLATYKPIGLILVDQKVISAKQLNLLLDKHRKRPRLGDILVKTKLLTSEQLESALNFQKTSGLHLGEALVQLNYVTEEAVRQALCTQLNIPYLDLDNLSIDASLKRAINKNYAKKHRIVPIARIGNMITLAMDDPTDVSLIQELQSVTGFTLNVVTSASAKIHRAFTKLYEDDLQEEPEPASGLELITEGEPQDLGKRRYVEEHHETQRADEAVRRIIHLALKNGASDIHFETLDNRAHIRFRIDGVLQEVNLGLLQENINKSRREIISRMKILAKLDIAEKRRPQDGSFRVRVERDREIIRVDVRVSIIPGYYGEDIVLRVLEAGKAPGSLKELGFSQPITEQLTQLLKRTTGVILITGPTGSGKSSTLYAALMTLYRPQIRILTAEDPIEYVYEHFSQCEVNEDIGNTFASYLRAFLRHDPEVIMIGEIRDEETAEMAFRAAQTGHLLLSSLHTNDAISSVLRLLDLKVDPNLIASSLAGVLSQRLVRQICSQCKEEYMPSEELLKEFFIVPPAQFRWQRGRGCQHCNFTGYKGRMAVGELWIPNERDIILINKGASFDEIGASSSESTIFMAEDAMEKVRDGRTNLEELIRVVPYSSIYHFRRLSAPTENGRSDPSAASADASLGPNPDKQ